MTFDKTKAMRNAERFLSQGKIRAAISEFEEVLKHDSRDFSTTNMLGDLYTKAGDTKPAIKCYSKVAEYYADKGFAPKAIAIYNKIARLEPSSLEVSERLAELYLQKGSVNEAKSHYVRLAENYESNGRMIEALDIWKQIAILDTTNTEVYVTIANSYAKEGHTEEAADAFVEAGLRFAKCDEQDLALEQFSRSLELAGNSTRALAAFLETSCVLGKDAEAVDRLRQLSEEFPTDNEIISHLYEAYLRSAQYPEAEKLIIRIVELEPANYPKFLDLARLYIDAGDLEAATRILTISSEHLLVGGQAHEFSSFVNEILEQDGENLDALRLLARFTSWQRDADAFRSALQRLATVGGQVGSIDDERYALSQLVMVMPNEPTYSARLREINDEFGYTGGEESEDVFAKRFNKAEPFQEDLEWDPIDKTVSGFAIASVSDGMPEIERAGVVNGDYSAAEVVASEAPNSSNSAIAKEIDSIKFYIESGYEDLARKAIDDLIAEHGPLPEVLEMLAMVEEPETETVPVFDPGQSPEADGHLTAVSFNSGFEDLRSELGIDDSDIDDSDYETHYNTGTAYKEMGLTEEAIREFQDAAALVSANDGTRRLFSCANLLGLCFMELGRPNMAVTWFQRALETPQLTPEEKQGIWYELANAHEADGDVSKAGHFFEQVYAENINFRDVSQRLRSMSIAV
ncbi:MAG: tetratricopeptide repeat protein [Blastocatellia bacterium]|nr:tetratricopeptide repeat protein [Blastocatellia bacterium]